MTRSTRSMCVAAVAAAALALPATVCAQGQESLEKKREEKLAKEVFHLTPWVTDFDAAKKQAKEEGKVLFAYFTRSYAY